MINLFTMKILVLLVVIGISQVPVFSQNKTDNPVKDPKEINIQQKTDNITNYNLKNKIKQPAEAEGENLFSTVEQGGPLMIVIIILGLIGLTIIVERIYFYLKSGLWKKSELETYLSDVVDKSNSRYKEQLDDELRDAFQLYINSAEKGMALLNGIGNIAPIFGFLGTVIGMIGAFAAIAAATTVNAKVVAVGIQVALVTTAGGLIVAAPMLAVFHFFNHLIQNIYKFADEIIFVKTTNLPSILVDKEQ